jgi:hypothetical protein
MSSTSIHDPEKASPSPSPPVTEEEHSGSIHNDTLEYSKEVAATPVVLDTKPSDQAAPLTALDWDDEYDPDNPHNWSASKRAYNTFVPGLLGLAITFGSSIYTPSYHEIAERYNISPVAALIPLSVWTFGLGFGPMLGAPLSEMHGRKIVYMISTPLSLLFTMGAGLSNSFTSLVICRFFGALFGSPILAVGAGTIADIYPPRERAQGAASFVAAPFLGNDPFYTNVVTVLMTTNRSCLRSIRRRFRSHEQRLPLDELGRVDGAWCRRHCKSVPQ